MRRLLLTFAVVLGVAVTEVRAQHHEAETKGHAAKKDVEKGEGAKGEGEKKPAAPAKPDAPPSVNELAERIGHVAVVIDSKRGRVMPVRERLGVESKDAKDEQASKVSPKGSASAHRAVPSDAAESERVAVNWPSRVELDWRVPLLAWPDELTQPKDEAPASH